MVTLRAEISHIATNERSLLAGQSVVKTIKENPVEKHFQKEDLRGFYFEARCCFMNRLQTRITASACCGMYFASG